jgi:hypothetical protein
MVKKEKKTIFSIENNSPNETIFFIDSEESFKKRIKHKRVFRVNNFLKGKIDREWAINTAAEFQPQDGDKPMLPINHYLALSEYLMKKNKIFNKKTCEFYK